MANQVTKLADIIEPKIFAPYIIKRTYELSEIISSGIAVSNPKLNSLIAGGGSTITMPHWQDLKGKSQVLSETERIQTGKIKAGAEQATVLIRSSGWASHELAGAFAGSSPMKAIADLVAEWWVRDEQTTLVNVLNGAFASSSMQDLVLDVSNDTISAKNVLKAKQLLGDAATKLTSILMHSATYTELQQQNLIEFIPNARGEIVIPTYLNYRVFQDDEMPYDPETSTFTTYLFKQGSIARGEGVPTDLTSVEVERDASASTDKLFTRRAIVLHPIGMSWLPSTTLKEATPLNEELANGDNWKRVFERKAMGIVKLKHTLSDFTPPTPTGFSAEEEPPRVPKPPTKPPKITE